MLGTLNAKHRKGHSDTEQPKKNIYHIGVYQNMKRTPKVPGSWNCTHHPFHNLINHSCFVEQTKFSWIQAEKKLILSPCSPFKSDLCRLFFLHSLDDISSVSHNISCHPWIKQTSKPQKSLHFQLQKLSCLFSVIKMFPIFS